VASDPKPFIKWPGGKRSSLATILHRPLPNFAGYHEPFLGGGAVFFRLRQSGYAGPADLSDMNHRLVVTYQAVRDDVESVIDMVAGHASLNASDHYYQARDDFSTETDPVKLAALFIYLNKAGFNGLYRENMSGKFNVAWGGDKPQSQLLDPAVLAAASRALRHVRLSCRSFETTEVVTGDLYYVDPPYDRTWTGYTKTGFGDVDQCAVADFCRQVDSAGGHFLASNADTPFIRSLYAGFDIERSMVKRSINRNGAGRGRVGEVLVTNC
jgi:DNA adenine methylase